MKKVMSFKKQLIIGSLRSGLSGILLGFFSSFAFFPWCPINYPYMAGLLGFPIGVLAYLFLSPSVIFTLTILIVLPSAAGFIMLSLLALFN